MTADATEQQTEQAPADVDTRLGAIETRQDKQESLLQQILDKLSGQPASGPASSPRGPDAGTNIGELIRQGVEELEARKTREQRESDAEQARRDHASRLAALEEAMPREPAQTPAGRLRAGIQRWGFGIDDPHR